ASCSLLSPLILHYRQFPPHHGNRLSAQNDAIDSGIAFLDDTSSMGGLIGLVLIFTDAIAPEGG
ncbi:MAG: hypothetical protein RLP02_34380, partial [Coleofasciculus sp. C2-GNP5-27]